MPGEPGPPAAPARPFAPAKPVVIGILGGIASGKSTVAALFAEHGLVHVDADAHARAVTGQAEVLALLAAAFGERIVVGGALDRAAMARLVFGDAAARTRLEAILHPRIRARILEVLAAAAAAGRSVVLDAPLLLEGGLIEVCDEVVFVEANEASRQQRAAARGWSPAQLAEREQAQRPLAEKQARAAHRIHNDGDLPATRRQVAALLDRLARTTR